MERDYYLGLDIGTGSVGWAVTNGQYEVLRAHGKALWGVRLFEGAKTAEDRRRYRTSRRRLDRRQWRIQLLQEIFAEEITKADAGFYLRMKESRYQTEDKRDSLGQQPKLPYALFTDKNFTDKDYYKKFPTIYHLRKWLMDTDETPDIRLVYLVMHHLMKHRGHFLLSGNIEKIKDFRNTFAELLKILQQEELDFNISIGEDEFKYIERVLRDKNTTKSLKKTRLVKELKASTSCEKAIFALISGGTAKLKDIFSDADLDNCERAKISFSDSGYDEYAGMVETDLGERFQIIEHLKAVYDWAILEEILGDYPSLSEAKVAQYEKHRADLNYLKKLVKENLTKEEYKRIFVLTDEKQANYCAYAGVTKYNGKKVGLAGKKCSQEEFYKFLKKHVIEKIGDEKKTAYLKAEIEKQSFLPKQKVKENGVIPYQVHLHELDKIIANMETKIPLLREEKEKLRSIFTFRIPYYVGPLNGIKRNDTTTNWVERKSTEKIYPWNFDDVVDRQTSAERFIRRMTNKCTYLYQEDVLPKDSMLYSKFMVLNELNNVRIDGELLAVDLKQKIYCELFQRSRKVTQKKLKVFLVREGIAGKDAEITGIDGEFKGMLTAYHDFKENLTGCVLSEEEKEEIILNIALFGADKKLLTQRLKVLFPALTEKQYKSLCRLSYSGWGKLSKRFLDGITAPAPETGEVWTIVRGLWESQDNLMQLLSEKYQFASAVQAEKQGGQEEKLSYKMVEEFPVSPAVKRQIWQTFLIVKELHKVLGEPPRKIFIEMAREKAEKTRTISRKSKFIDLYKKCKAEERDWLGELAGIEEQTFRSDKLYLYYTQKGRCMYSGESIDLDELWNDQKYDIDHIYPQSRVMDDSLDNRVLVKKTCNSKKADNYPVAKVIQEQRRGLWKSLLDGGFITKEKYNRLTRTTEFEPAELAGFIARQLVETRQSTKAVASILKQVLPDTEIIYVKAKITSQFRQDFELIKVRDMNDFHHAKDAYLNIVTGNAYHTKFTSNPMWYINENPRRSYNIRKLFTSDRDIARNGVLAWKAGKAGTICTVKDVMSKNNILVTRYSYERQGGLFDQQLMKKGKGQVPVKGNDDRLADIEKYGGYNNAAGSYYVLAESENKKGNLIRTIEYIPLYLVKQIGRDEAACLEYLQKKHGLKNPSIRYRKIKTDTLFKIDGFYMWISGRQQQRLRFKGAIQLVLSQEEQAVLKKILIYVERRKKNKELKIIEHDKIVEADLIHLYETFLYKLEHTIYKVCLSKQAETLADKKDKFLLLSLEDKCQVLAEILHLFQCQSNSANLELLGGAKQVGIITANTDITKFKQISIINQSPTGIYEEVIDLKTV